MCRVLLVDEHSVFRSGLRQLIESSLENVRVTETGRVVDGPQLSSSDLVLIDRGSVDEIALRLSETPHRNMRVAIMSNSRMRADAFSYLAGGFHGFICKLDSDKELLSAVSDLLSGRIYVPRWVADDDAAGAYLGSAGREVVTPDLTLRQSQVLPLLAQGMSNKEIARHLGIAEGTTKIHVAAVVRALEARNRTDAALKAARRSGPSTPGQSGVERVRNNAEVGP